MRISGLEFLAFAAAAAVLYYLLPKRQRWLVLLAASVLFYLTYGVRVAVYLAATVLYTFLFALWLEKIVSSSTAAETKEERKRLKRLRERKKRLVLALALIVNFASLILLKYGAFLVSVVRSVVPISFEMPKLLLPLGISFYVFQTSSYLLDVSRSKHPAERNLLHYALFVCYFPQMLQGPINRYRQMEPQLIGGSDFELSNIQHGFFRFLYGLLKKALIADTLAPIVETIYSGYASYPGVICFFGAALYCLQLYCDFSGGIDMMMGVSALFGVNMQENFCRPYFSTSLTEFWRRWHISLGEWMKDYLFYPIALSKGFSKLARSSQKHLPLDIAKCIVPSISTVIVFLAVGIWQGPGYANIAYGLWNGFWMSLALFWAPLSKRLDARIGFSRHPRTMTVIGVLRTNVLVIFGRYFSNASSLGGALGMLKQTFLRPGFSQVTPALFTGLGLSASLLWRVVPMLCAVFAIGFAEERKTDVVQWLCSRKWAVQFLAVFLLLLIAVLAVYGNSGYTPIAYVYENI